MTINYGDITSQGKTNLLHSEEQENSEPSNILQFPDKKPKNRLQECMKRINAKNDDNDVKAIFAVVVDNEENMDIHIAGGVSNVKTSLLISSILDSMRHKIVEQASNVVLPGVGNG